MSGICGVVSFGEGNPDPNQITPVVDALRRRGPDRVAIWTSQAVTLGHTLLATTPEAAIEAMPFEHLESGCVITADARLDNRDDLMRSLALGDRSRIVGDGELILRAYLEWGDDCPGRLLGDFAFAIWDDRRRRLFCARDQMGIRQLTYAHVPGRAFIFATEPRAVLRHELVPKGINEGRIADFLDNMERGTLTETFYSAISRLPPAHWLTLDNRGLTLGRYWRLEMPPALRLNSDDEYVEAFLDVFRTAVAARVRSGGDVGSMLSGGMDSGAVSAIAAEVLAEQGRGPLPTFSVAAGDSSKSPETLAIEQSAQMQGIAPRILRIADMAEYRQELLRATKDEDEPFDGQMNLLRMVYRAASREGFKVVLDGVGGDIVLSGTTYMAKLLRAGHLRTAWREARGSAHFWSVSSPPWSILARNLWAAWAPQWAVAARRKAYWSLVDRQIGRRGLISKHFADEVDLRGRRRKTRLASAAIGTLDEDQRAQSIAYAILTIGRERYDRVASAYAVEARDPFMDLRVIDFCLSLPWQQLQSGGWPKILLRRAMRDRLPDSVTWRPGIDHLGYEVMREVFGALGPADVDQAGVDEILGRYVRADRRAVLPFDWDDRQRCIESIEALCLSYWLQSASRTFQR